MKGGVDQLIKGLEVDESIIKFLTIRCVMKAFNRSFDEEDC